MGARCKATPLSSVALRADARAARYECISPYPIGARYSVLASLVLTAQSDPKNREYGTSATPFKKQGVRHKCHSLFLWLAPCLALRSVPLMGTEIVGTRLNEMRQALHAVYRVLSRKVSLYFERIARVPRYLHISAFPIGNRYSVADSVRSLQLPSAPPTLRADARAARYESISPYPIGARYSVLASLVLTAQKVVDCIKKKPVKADFFCLSVIARCRRARRT